MSEKPTELPFVARSSAKFSAEQVGFSNRLQQSLRKADYSPDSPTQLAREFNIRFSGAAITVHAARKWLVGEAIPTQEKLRTLAEWLNVRAEWLRFGEAQPDTGKDARGSTRFSPDVAAALEILQKLDDHHRRLAQQMLRVLLQASDYKLQTKSADG